MENQASVSREERRALLLEQAHSASTSPGVYLMKGPTGDVLYVGKAKNLKNRLVTYFQPAAHPIVRIELLVSRIETFEIILTETEAEALILEWTLIKKHKPHFNIRLKDDKSYPYLKIQREESFPRLEWTRKVLKDGARYFGPFPSAYAARQVLELLNETFQLRDCSDNTFRHRSRPCILHSIGKCSAPCVGKISAEDYRDVMTQVVNVLDGKGSALSDDLKAQMQKAADEEDFERAAEIRDRIKNLEIVTETQSVIQAGSQRNHDVIGIARVHALAHGTVIEVRAGRMMAVKHFVVQNADASFTEAELLSGFLAQYYVGTQRDEAKADGRPGELSHDVSVDVLVATLPTEEDVLSRALRLNIRMAETPAEAQLVSVARTNAEYALEQASQKAAGHGMAALENVQERLGLPKLPSRIECYDISNIQGTDAVGSRVVFIDGAPDKNLYRRYKIRTVEGANDFAMMKEVLSRRFAALGKPGDERPDLVVVDGGKGQLAQAVAIFEELNLQGIEVVGLAKARTERDFKSKDVKASMERIFIPNRKNPVSLYPTSDAYKLLTHIRDEAHRFAVSYHRKVRSKRQGL